MSCGCVVLNTAIPISWESIVCLLAGSMGVLLILLPSYLVVRWRNLPFLQNLFLFGILCDLPNLLPLLPQYHSGVISDGFNVLIFLIKMDLATFYPLSTFYLLSVGSTVITLFGFYFLGKFFLELITIPWKRIESVIHPEFV
ncbi:MAG: hypothetical protein ACFFG0_55865 [Candidatus Thorarchaeota archaeon]